MDKQVVRQYVLDNNIHASINKLGKVARTSKNEYESRQAYYDILGLAMECSADNIEVAQSIVDESDRINDAYYHRLGRLKHRVKRMCDIGCIFCTLTFTDEVLNKTSEATRSKYVQRWLTSFEAPYVANRDYGCQSHREHYHAVICTDLESVSVADWSYGYSHFEEVGTTRCYRVDKGIYERNRKKRDDTPEYDGDRTSRYLNKLSNHAVKETTKGARIKYSRNIDAVLFQLESDILGDIFGDVESVPTRHSYCKYALYEEG